MSSPTDNARQARLRHTWRTVGMRKERDGWN